MMKNGVLTTELSLFNEIKIFQNVSIVEMYDQKLVLVKPIPRKDNRFFTIAEILEEFADSEDSDEHKEWRKIFKSFHQTYDKVMKRQSRKKTKSDTRKRFYSKVDAQTQEKTNYLYANFPILQLKYRLRNHQIQLYELVFSETFIAELGYSIDSFVNSVLKEGLPQLMPLNNSWSTTYLKALIGHYFTIEDSGYEISDQVSTLFMKNGYVKDVKYQTNLLMNYETNTFGMDVMFALTAKGEPYMMDPKYRETTINETFVQNMSKKEEETDMFLSMYYDVNLEKRYSYYDKICQIKELEAKLEDDDIIVKKDEDA